MPTIKSIAVIELMSSRRPSFAGLYENANGATVPITFGVNA